jgi:demethylspheroidene O-methyltransferase
MTALSMPGSGQAAGWRDRLRDWQQSLEIDAGFRAWAARFPLTRPIARRRARALFDLCTGFVYSQTLLAAVQLRLFETLRDAPLPLPVLAARLQLSEAAAQCLLRATDSLQLTVRRRDGRHGIGPLGAALLGDPGIVAMVQHHATLYRDLADPVALLRRDGGGTGLAGYWAYARASAPPDPAQVAAYTRLMAATQPMISAEILAAYDLSQHRRLLDVGGGDGSFLAAAGRAAPSLEVHLFDLPAVLPQAEARLGEAGLLPRATLHGGSFRTDSLPLGCDAISLVRVVHDHDDLVAQGLLRKAYEALPAGGRLLLAEPMAETPGAEPMGGAYFGFYLFAMGSGRPRSAVELTSMLRTAGFGRVRELPTALPLLTRVLIADRD